MADITRTLGLQKRIALIAHDHNRISRRCFESQMCTMCLLPTTDPQRIL